MEEAIAKMKQTDPHVDVRSVKLDLQDFQSVKSAIAEFQNQESSLDILVCNAGVRHPCFSAENWLTLGPDHGISI